MTLQTNDESRLLRSARALKAFFENKLKTRFEFLTEAPKPSLDGDLEFNWALSQAGVWGLRPDRMLSPSDRQEVAATFETILGAIDDMKSRGEGLARLENRLQTAMEETPSNVIPLRRTQGRGSEMNLPKRKRWTLRLDCLIEGADPLEIHKMASELHDQSSRYAFVNYQDLDKNERLMPSELLELGAITLFVPNVLELSRSEQQVLKYIASLATEERPLMMVGSLLPYAELLSEPRVDSEFLGLLVRAYIKLTRPFKEYKEQGLIQYFLDSLSENPS